MNILKTSFILPLGEDLLIGCEVFKPKKVFKLQPLYAVHE